MYKYLTILFFIIFVSSASAYQASFTPRLTLTEEYTDNFLQTENNREDDFITTISPGFTFDISERTNGVALSYDLGFIRYRDFPDYDNISHDLEFMGWAEITRNTRFDVLDTFELNEEPTAIRGSRERHYTNTASAILEHRFGESDVFNVEYEHIINDYEETTLNNNKSHNPSVLLEYWFLPQFGFDSEASYTQRKYEEASAKSDTWYGSIRLIKQISRHLDGYIRYEHTDYNGDPEDYQIYNPSIGIDYFVDEDMHLTLEGGYLIRDREGSEDESQFIIEGELDKTWRFRRGLINLTGSSGYTDANTAVSGAETLGFTIYHEGECGAAYNFSRTVTGGISGLYRQDNYDNYDRRDSTIEAETGLTWQPLQWMFVGLRYSYESLESTTREDFRENRGEINLTFVPSRPFRN